MEFQNEKNTEQEDSGRYWLHLIDMKGVFGNVALFTFAHSDGLVQSKRQIDKQDAKTICEMHENLY